MSSDLDPQIDGQPVGLTQYCGQKVKKKHNVPRCFTYFSEILNHACIQTICPEEKSTPAPRGVQAIRHGLINHTITTRVSYHLDPRLFFRPSRPTQPALP